MPSRGPVRGPACAAAGAHGVLRRAQQAARARDAGALDPAITATVLRNMLCAVRYTALTPDRAEAVANLDVEVILRGLRRR